MGNSRFLITFLIAILIIVIALVIIFAVIFHAGARSSVPATATPAAVSGGVRVHNDTGHTVQVQDCTGPLSGCASSNMGTTTLAANASGAERGATGLRFLDSSGKVLGCIDLSGTSAGSVVQVSSARACP